MKAKTSETNQNFRNLLVKEIGDIKLSIRKLQLTLRRAESALSAYDATTMEVRVAKKKVKLVRTAFPTSKKPADRERTKRITAADRLENVLEKFRVPLTSSEALKAMNEAFPEKKLSSESWSPQLSTIYKDDKRPFRRIEFKENPNETRYFYGLKKWFDGDVLKQEYMERLAKRHKIYAGPVTESLFKIINNV